MAKRTKTVVGDLIGIPRSDGQLVLGQVMDEWMMGVICVAVFDLVLDDKRLPAALVSLHPKAISMPSVAKSEIERGHWPLLGSGPLMADVERAPHNKFKSKEYIGASWHSGKMVEDLVNAYFKIGSWDPYPGRPGLLRTLLLEPM